MDELIKTIKPGVLIYLCEATFDNIVDQYSHFKNKFKLK